jgi:hypothetical protein
VHRGPTLFTVQVEELTQMPEEFIWAMAWRRALGLAFLELAVPILICYLVLTILFFQKGESSVGTLCVVCWALGLAIPVGVLIALIAGWQRAGRWQMRAFLSLFTGLVVLQTCNVVAILVLPNLDGTTLRWLFGVDH